MNTRMPTELDPLIDLLDAEEFESLLAREELRRSRTGESLAVAVLDVDGMRVLTTRHGAAARDDALRLCASVLSSSIRTVDEPAHTGHDEFCVLLHATDAANVSVWVERFEEELGFLDAMLQGVPLLSGRAFGLADIAFLPWLLRARDLLGISLEPWPALADWVERSCERPSIAAEQVLVAAL